MEQFTTFIQQFEFFQLMGMAWVGICVSGAVLAMIEYIKNANKDV